MFGQSFRGHRGSQGLGYARASCVLHGFDAESYLTDIVRVLPYWSRDRYLELAPKYWAQTRARLHEAELKLPIGHVTVPPPLPAEQQPSTD